MGKTIIKVRDFYVPLYLSRVIFVYSNSYKAVEDFGNQQQFHEKSMTYIKKHDYDGYTFDMNDLDGCKYHYVVVIKNPDKYEEIDTITHEITHLTEDILGVNGVKYTKSNGETIARLTGYLNKEFFKFKDGK